MKQRRGNRSIIIRAGIFLLLGAIVNIAVAWGMTVLLAANARQVVHELAGLESFPAHIWPEDYPPPTWSWQITSTGVSVIEIHAGYGRSWSAKEVCGGWPALTLAGHSSGSTAPSFSSSNDKLWEVSLPWVGAKSLPLRPLWPGFALNTLFYGAILWLLLALPGALRRCRRIKRGLCPACAYPVGASDLCTECGQPVTRMR